MAGFNGKLPPAMDSYWKPAKSEGLRGWQCLSIVAHTLTCCYESDKAGEAQKRRYSAVLNGLAGSGWILRTHHGWPWRGGVS